MGEKRVKLYLDNMDDYIEKIKGDTREEALNFLVSAGIVNENGELKYEYSGNKEVDEDVD